MTYFLRSSVLGGRVVAELDQSGQKRKGYVFVNGQLLAEQSNNWVTWHHDNPLTGSQGISSTNGGFDAKAEPDPMGVNIGFHDPYINCCIGPPPDDQGMPFLLGSFSAGKCKSDGIAIDCVWAMEMLANGSGVQCPNNDCGPRTVTVDITYTNHHRDTYSGLTSPFAAFFNGESGFSLGGIVRPIGFNITFTGKAARAAARAFFSGIGNFGSALIDAIDAGLRSLYSQNTAGGGGGGGGYHPKLNTGAKARFNFKKFSSCLQDFFGIVASPNDVRFSRTNGGSFQGYSSNGSGAKPDYSHGYHVDTDVASFSSGILGLKLRNAGAGLGGANSGATFEKDPYHNYIASDAASYSQNTAIGLFGLYIHETGNALGVQTGLEDTFGGYAAQNQAHGINDPDVGAAFETCVFGGLVGLQSGRVGSHREF